MLLKENLILRNLRSKNLNPLKSENPLVWLTIKLELKDTFLQIKSFRDVLF